MLKNFRNRIFPYKKQLEILEAILHEYWWPYNHLLVGKDSWEQEEKVLTSYEQQFIQSFLKVQHSSLQIIHARVLQNIAAHIYLVMNIFFVESKSGIPRFCEAHRFASYNDLASGHKAWLPPKKRLDVCIRRE